MAQPSHPSRTKQAPSGQLIGATVGSRWSDFTPRQREQIEAMLRSIDKPAHPIDEFQELWERWQADTGRDMPLPPNWRRSIQRWLARGLTIDDLTENVEATMEANPRKGGSDRWFRYFAEICWSLVRDIEDEEDDGRGYVSYGR